MDTIFSIRDTDLSRYTDAQAVEFFSKLLYAEASRIQLPTNKLHISKRINVGDGGIDASVEDHQLTIASNIIIDKFICFQIKAGESFKPWEDAKIKKELFGRKHPQKENLNESVRNCLDNNGTYILITFGHDMVDRQYRAALQSVTGYLKQCGYESPKVDVWCLHNLKDFLKPFPSLSLDVKGIQDANMQTHKSWERNDDMQKPLVTNTDFEEKIDAFRKSLMYAGQAVHLRVIAEAGSGKTRFVFEATKTDEIAPLVIYTKANSFINNVLFTYICREDNDFNAVLIIDECSSGQRVEIWNKLQHLGPRIKLVTIYNQQESQEYGTEYPDLPNLSQSEIEKILEAYGIPKDQVSRWAQLAGSSPRFAHMIGSNLQHFPDDVLRPIQGIYDRIIAGYEEDPTGQEVAQRRRVLNHLALFRRFGFGRPYEEEAKVIGSIIERADRSITYARFLEFIAKLKLLKILQGENTLYITPAGFHIQMWKEWWDIYGSSFDFEDFISQIPEQYQLREWFYEMFEYADQSGAANAITAQLLGPGGPLEKAEIIKKKLESRLFLALAKANPKASLTYLERTIGTWDKEKLLQFTTGRREVVWALEYIVIWRELFLRAAKILLKLAEAENENYGNNATGVFADIFSPAYGEVAPTEASPEERFPILQEAISSPSESVQLIALQACKKALETDYFIRSIGNGYHPLVKKPNRWKPKTWGELYTAYQNVWSLVYENLDKLSENARKEGVKILLDRARGLGRIHHLSNMVLDTLSKLATKPYIDKEAVLSTIVTFIHYDKKDLTPELLQKWEKLRDDLVGNDFTSQLKRYVGMNLLEDDFNEQGQRTNQRQLAISNLADKVMENNKLLFQELPWLFTEQAKNGYLFGHELGKMDNNFSLLGILLEKFKQVKTEKDIFFLSGYLKALFDKDITAWEKELDKFATDEELRKFVPELTWRSGITDRAALRILELARKDKITFTSFRIFGLGSVIEKLSEDTFRAWIEFLLTHKEASAISIILDLYEFYYLRNAKKPNLPLDLTVKVLTHPSLFNKEDAAKRSQMDEHIWHDLYNAFVDTYPDEAIKLADAIIEHFGEDGTILDGYYSKSQETLTAIAIKYPEKIWEKIAKYLGPPVDGRSFHLASWLEGSQMETTDPLHKERLSLFPAKSVFSWVEGNPEERAPYLAEFVPAKLFADDGKTCFARELLVRYGTLPKVRKSLLGNFMGGGWFGPESEHYTKKKNEVLTFKEKETNVNVRSWIDEYVDLLDKLIMEAKNREEREGF